MEYSGIKRTVVKNLPNDCICVPSYAFPFKFTGEVLYVYEPFVNCLGDAVWLRRTHDFSCILACCLRKDIRKYNIKSL